MMRTRLVEEDPQVADRSNKTPSICGLPHVVHSEQTRCIPDTDQAGAFRLAMRHMHGKGQPREWLGICHPE